MVEFHYLSKGDTTMFASLLVVLNSYLATPGTGRGQGMAEYGLLLALIAVVVIVALNVHGRRLPPHDRGAGVLCPSYQVDLN
ncbi:MAG: hypothetical protein M5U28_52740, partial [Sandaracinaceae bacterium]|nr:hypothetical protein [Sandaracinaceae bacterium]